MISCQQLRASVAMAHMLPGSFLSLSLSDGATVVVGTHPAADVHPCHLRRILLAEELCDDEASSRYIDAIQVGGRVVEVGPSIYTTSAGQFVFPTLLSPDVVEAMFRCHRTAEMGSGAFEARLSADGCLGVTLVMLAAEDDAVTQSVAEAAVVLAGLCLAEEMRRALIACMRSPTAHPDPDPETTTNPSRRTAKKSLWR